MTTLRTILLAGTVLSLSTPVFAEDAHHPETPAEQTSEQMAQPSDSGADPSSMMSCGMMSGDMMGNMMRMMAGGPGGQAQQFKIRPRTRYQCRCATRVSKWASNDNCGHG